jgi:hypothetical protein
VPFGLIVSLSKPQIQPLPGFGRSFEMPNFS